MELKMRKALLEKGEAVFACKIEADWIQFQQTRKDVQGDTTLVVFPFVKTLKCSPIEAGEKIGAFLKSNVAGISAYEVIHGFLNITFSNDYWNQVLGDVFSASNYGFNTPNSKPLMMVEYSSPNTNKPLHLGHLRNIFLGYSVSELLKAFGHKVIKTQVINDRGIHICKSMLAWQQYAPVNAKGERETPALSHVKGDKFVGKYYVEFDKRMNAEADSIIQNWNENRFQDTSSEVQIKFQELQKLKNGKDEKGLKSIDAKIKDLAKEETAILRDAKEMLIKWEARDPGVYLLWSTMNSWVYEGFEATYKRMGVDFDTLYYESDTFLLGKDQVMEGLKKGVFFQKPDRSVWIDLSSDGLDEKLVLRSDGTAVYMTQDIGTAIDRFTDYPDLNGIIYTVGNEQDYHFKVLFLILKKLGFTWAENCFHLSYGMVDLPTGKMKSREGTVVDADDLMEEVVQAASEITKERGHISEMAKKEQENLFEQIGLGGLKYYLLKVDPKKRMMFNPEDSIDLSGNTGPFIQYTHARIHSLLQKSEIDISTITTFSISDYELELVKCLSLYPKVIEEAANNYSPALLSNYLYELTKEFNSFYQAHSILNEKDLAIKNARLCIASSVQKVLFSGLKILGIEAPKKM